ncbi:hypothetical protein KPL70_011888 [Citrus sinensis]|nr:hypothetical protein KPL70_011888 [Citrus sinensis]
MSLNSKAMNALFCALDKKEFHRVSSCESAQEIWNKLEVVYEGTNQVKESKISRYTRQYELFQMEQNENVYSMYTRFTDIVNTLGALGKTFLNSEKVNKIIRSLPKEWRPKKTTIEEAKDLNTLPLDDLIGSLISYEEDLAAEKGHEEKKKSIALKASKYESEEESESDDEELAILARMFRKFFKKIGERRNFKNFKNHREKKEAITCYECKRPGHIRSECPLINKLKKKAIVATWDDSEEESNNEEGSQELSNLAHMAIGGDDDLNEGLKKKKNKWYLDNGCSRHMTGNYAWFSSFSKIKNSGDVSFGDNSKEKILGIGNVGKISSTLIENAEAVNTACYVLNRVLIRPNLNKIPYELWKDKKPNIGYFKVFICKCFVLNTKDNLGKFDPKSDVGIFLGYSNSSKAYRVYNKRTLVVEESIHVTFDESNPSSTEKVAVDDNAEEEQQEEAPNDNQEDVPHRIQEEHHEEPNVEQNEEFSSCMSKEFEMSMMGELKYFLGLQIKQYEEGIFINQAKYVKDLLKRFGIDDSKTKNTPMSTTTKLDKDEKGKEVDIKMYRCMIGSLLYFTASRPDIMFSVCLCARFQCPKESHLLAVKRIFRYLSGTIDIGLWYPRGTHIDLTCYWDADFAGYKVDRKSTSGTCYILGHSLVSWFSKKQNSVALSTTDAKYIAAGSCCAQAL